MCPHVRERPLVSSFFRVFLSFLGGRGHALQHVGSSFPTQGLNPHPLHWKNEVLTTGPLGKSLSLFISLFVCFLGCARSSLLRAGFLQLQSGRFSLLPCTGTRAHGLQKLRLMGLDAPRYVGSSWTRDRTRAPCIGRWIFFFFLQVDS